MTDDEPKRTMSTAEQAERRQRAEEALVMQEIEGNPLTPEEIAMFERFEREGWSDERQRAYILALLKPAVAAQ